MKRIYEKPQIMFESFTLSTNIAGDCITKTWTPNSGTCYYPVTVLGKTYNVFTSEVTGENACTTIEEDGEFETAYNTICYHVPSGDNLFNS